MKKYKVKGIEIDGQNTISTYGNDIVDDMTKILSEQLAIEIDREILNSLGVFVRPVRRKNSIQKIFNDKAGKIR